MTPSAPFSPGCRRVQRMIQRGLQRKWMRRRPVCANAELRRYDWSRIGFFDGGEGKTMTGEFLLWPQISLNQVTWSMLTN